jgi:hypothetical protein
MNITLVKCRPCLKFWEETEMGSRHQLCNGEKGDRMDVVSYYVVPVTFM